MKPMYHSDFAIEIAHLVAEHAHAAALASQPRGDNIGLAAAETRRGVYLSYKSVRQTALAFSNYELACASDTEDTELAENPELACELLYAGACWDGLRTVGMKANSWEHLGRLIEQADQPDWLGWCECLDDRIDEICKNVSDGFRARADLDDFY